MKGYMVARDNPSQEWAVLPYDMSDVDGFGAYDENDRPLSYREALEMAEWLNHANATIGNI